MLRLTTRSTLLALALVGCATDDKDGADTDVAETDETDTQDPSDTDVVDTDPGLPDVAGVTCPSEDVCILSGTITEDLTLTANRSWVLSGGVIIGDDVNETVLTIKPGTTVYGESATGGFLNIARHARLEAVGTAERPIVFTADQPEGSRARGSWGGIVLRGLAPINVCTEPPAGGAPCEADLEGGAGKYGGDDVHDSSGTLKYVRVEFAGYAISPDNELNGITFGGVGDGTVVENVQSHFGNDDGVEFFGGTVNVKRLVVSCTTDDGIDWDNGYAGHIQFGLVVQCDEAGNNGLEGDNHPSNFTVAPLSNPTFSNLTVLGDPSLPTANFGMMIRRGTEGQFTNVLVDGFDGTGSACMTLRDQATVDHLTTGGGFDHVLFGCGTAFEGNSFATAAQDLFDAGTGNDSAAGDLKLVLSSWPTTADPDFKPKAGSPAVDGGAVPSGAFFEAASYVGAFDPSGADWTDGWTTWVTN